MRYIYLLIAILLVGCDSTNEPTAPQGTSPLVGTWTLSARGDSNAEPFPFEIWILRENGDFTWEQVNDNNTCTGSNGVWECCTAPQILDTLYPNVLI